jgi:hypothetical protein
MRWKSFTGFGAASIGAFDATEDAAKRVPARPVADDSALQWAARSDRRLPC